MSLELLLKEVQTSISRIRLHEIEGKKLIKRLLKNRKGTAEVIGSVMFIIILLFFFTNVYLWHDAAVKEMNDLQVQKIHTTFVASISYDGTKSVLSVTNKGAIDVSLSMLWINEKSSTNSQHLAFDLKNAVVVPGDSIVSIPIIYDPTGKTVIFKVLTTAGTIEPCPLLPYSP
jgi:hypothetical protein